MINFHYGHIVIVIARTINLISMIIDINFIILLIIIVVITIIIIIKFLLMMII